MRLAKGFRDLQVYQRARAETREIFLTSRAFPPEERFALTDQIRRSSRAVGAMIAEAWAKRRYRARIHREAE
jgi:four helix bundle protein